MKNFTKVFLGLALGVAFALGGTAFADDEQVSADSWRTGDPRTPFQNRSDGFFWHRTKKTPVFVGNGSGFTQMGPTYFDTFAYGASKGLQTLQHDGTAFDGTAGVINLAYFGTGVKLAYTALFVQTLDIAMDAASLDIAGDQTANDGYELLSGVNGATGRPFVIGDDPAFKFCATVAVEDVSGTDDFHIGFRRSEAVNATFDNYLDVAGIGPISGDITIETILNNAATTTTDTTDNAADAQTVAYCVFVGDDGAVTYTLDGQAPTVTAAFTFDDGDPVVPFVHFLQDADLTGEVDVTLWEVGYQ